MAAGNFRSDLHRKRKSNERGYQRKVAGTVLHRRQAVQTLSRLNRAYQSGPVVKDTTYVLDFVNSSEEILAAFQTYYETASLENVTDPNLVYDLRATRAAMLRSAAATTRARFSRSSIRPTAILSAADRLYRTKS